MSTVNFSVEIANGSHEATTRVKVWCGVAPNDKGELKDQSFGFALPNFALADATMAGVCKALRSAQFASKTFTIRTPKAGKLQQTGIEITLAGAYLGENLARQIESLGKAREA